MNYKKLNNITGWLVFGIALITYLLTVAPTASFWDCGEFIACANELEIGHPPGNPIYLLLGRIFAMFAFGNVENIAYMVNLLSVFSAAFTVLFIFWSVTIIAKKIVANDDEEPSMADKLLILLSGAVAALTTTFLDTFWFNAVEAEVYAMSSFFTAIVFWLMLKWEQRADQAQHFRWIILIAYMMGLSIGVHLLNLLAIPALALVYYFRKYEFSWAGVAKTIGISVGILGFILFGITQSTIKVVKWFELIFTGTTNPDGTINTGMGMPFGTGGVIFGLIALGIIGFGLWYSIKKKNVWLNTSILSLIAVYIGFLSYAVIFIRSSVDPPIDENNPENVIDFDSFVSREQYGDKPLFSGPLFNARPVSLENDKKNYYVLSEKDVNGEIKHKKYIQDGYKQKYKYASTDKIFFPRMYSPSHYNKGPFGYVNFVSNKGMDPNNPADDKPSGGDNMKFFFEYQIKHMYIRYFMWNFVGRTSDVQDDDWQNGGWESGLNFSKTESMPDWMRNSKSRNHYFFLPLLLGILGAVWNYKKDKKKFAIIALMFFFTGLAIVIYLNQIPLEPRERDYVYAGSFQTFSMWIGLSVIGLKELLEKYVKLKGNAVYAAGAIALLASPVILAVENWDDHSRAGRYIAPDSAYNLLNSCEKNAILFTNGDNDTFPLWYIQEVEGVRTDVRVVNLSLLNTDWYIERLKKQANESDPLPITIPESEIIGDKNAIVPFKPTLVNLPVDKNAILKNKVVSQSEINQVESPMKWQINPTFQGQYIMKSEYVILDLILNNAKNGWKRPIYFAVTIPQSSYMNLMNYFQLEGLAYRLIPINTPSNPNSITLGKVDKDKMYNNLVKNFKLRNLDNPNVYYDDNIRRMVSNFRIQYMRLAESYITDAEKLDQVVQNKNLLLKVLETQEADQSSIDSLNNVIADAEKNAPIYRKKALEVINYSLTKMTDEAVMMEPYTLVLMARTLEKAGDKKKAEELFKKAEDRAFGTLNYKKAENKLAEDQYNMYAVQMLFQTFLDKGDFDNAIRIGERVQQLNGDPKFVEFAKSKKQVGGGMNEIIQQLPDSLKNQQDSGK